METRKEKIKKKQHKNKNNIERATSRGEREKKRWSGTQGDTKK